MMQQEEGAGSCGTARKAGASGRVWREAADMLQQGLDHVGMAFFRSKVQGSEAAAVDLIHLRSGRKGLFQPVHVPVICCSAKMSDRVRVGAQEWSCPSHAESGAGSAYVSVTSWATSEAASVCVCVIREGAVLGAKV